MELIYKKKNHSMMKQELGWEDGDFTGIDRRANGDILLKLRDGLELTPERLVALNKLFPAHKRDCSVVPFQEGEIRDLEKEMDDLKLELANLKTQVVKG